MRHEKGMFQVMNEHGEEISSLPFQALEFGNVSEDLNPAEKGPLSIEERCARDGYRGQPSVIPPEGPLDPYRLLMFLKYMSKKRTGLVLCRAVKDFQMRTAHDLCFRITRYFLRSRIELDDRSLRVDKRKAYGQTPDDRGVHVGRRKNVRLTGADGRGIWPFGTHNNDLSFVGDYLQQPQAWMALQKHAEANVN